jgi:hypothetical protein
MNGITKDQIMLLHVLKAKLSMSEDEYRAALQAYGAVSSTELSMTNAEQLIRAFTERAVAAGTWKRPRKRSRREGLQDQRRSHPPQDTMATTAQINMLDGMWRQVSRATDDEMRRRAFDKFIHHRFHRGGLMMVERMLVPRIVRALEAMGAEVPC